MSTDNPIVTIPDISKPATVLIEKISEAIGGLYKPYQIKRVAKAEVEVERIRAQGQIEITELQRRALTRFIEEEGRKQDNIENIISKATPHLDESANPQGIENDWIANFFDKSRIVSDDEMQSLWARILAGEANSPGRFSKRTVNFVSSIDKTDAVLFTHLCGFCWTISYQPLAIIMNTDDKVYTTRGITFESLQHLDDIGLISFDPLAGYRSTLTSQRGLIMYYQQLVGIQFKEQGKTDLPLGKVLLTKTGKQMVPIAGGTIVEGLVDYMIEKWEHHGITAKLLA
jgi:hypothetical protein